MVLNTKSMWRGAPGESKRLSLNKLEWFKGSKEEVKNKYSEVRNIIYNKIKQLENSL